MSDMLSEAIVDAKALRDAALKNAENIVIENDKKEDGNVEHAILNILDPLKNKEYIDVKTINEKMLILKGLYGLSSKIFLSRGKNQGGFIVNVKVSYKDKQFLTSIKNNHNLK